MNSINKLKRDQFENVLARISYALNRRPLTPVSKNINDYSFITPSHFLQPPIAHSDPNNPIDLTSVFDESQTISKEYYNKIWNTWISLYLPSLFERQKWYSHIKPFKIGDLILYKTNDKFNKNYPLGRISELIMGSDNVVRHVKISSESGPNLIVPVHQAARLEEDWNEPLITTPTADNHNISNSNVLLVYASLLECC